MEARRVENIDVTVAWPSQGGGRRAGPQECHVLFSLAIFEYQIRVIFSLSVLTCMVQSSRRLRYQILGSYPILPSLASGDAGWRVYGQL